MSRSRFRVSPPLFWNQGKAGDGSGEGPGEVSPPLFWNQGNTTDTHSYYFPRISRTLNLVVGWFADKNSRKGEELQTGPGSLLPSVFLKMTFSESFQNGLQSAKKNLKPAMVIWAIGIALVVGAQKVPPVLQALEAIVDFRKETEPWFSLIAFAIAGALFPYFIELAIKEKDERDSWKGLLVKAALWSANGIVTKQFFALLDEWFGQQPSLASVSWKVFFDQFFYAAFVTTPIITILYLWAGKDLSFTRTRDALNQKAFRWRYLETYIANLSVWLVAACIMFSAPGGATLIFALVLMTFWGMALSALSR